MTPSRGTAVAIALLTAALAVAGCGLGRGEDVGEASLVVSRDYGREQVLAPVTEEIDESDTVMRLLDRNAEIETRYSGDFVEAIDGLAADRGDGRAWDWLYYVNGVEATVGGADYELRGGETIWWDYRDWSAALRVPAVVGSWPQPFREGYEGEPAPTLLECFFDRPSCSFVRDRLRSAGARLVKRPAEEAIRVLAGPWWRLRQDPAAAQIEKGPQSSGVFAELVETPRGPVLIGLDEGGEVARTFGPDAGLVAATRRAEGPPVWVVTGASAAGAVAASRLLDARALRNRYAVAIEGAEETPLPLPR
ncbi:MAG TPA: DUF4430 domain-containing protein [Solirubrobacterales bacterium]|nr:DUF4430 domain-containing protein [Solirubrobacterales bacterium]